MKKTIINFFFFYLLCLQVLNVCAMAENDTDLISVVQEIEQANISFNYTNEDIINIINHLAALKNVNVIFPPADTLKVTVTINFDKKMTLSQAWEVLNTLLDIAGFFIVPQGSLIRIVKSGKEISREPMPTYIGTNPNDLPNTDQPIRYLYYLANIKVADTSENEIIGILKDLLPENAFYKADSVTNSLLFVAKANDIRSVMKIIAELDTVGFQEKVDIISLRHTSAVIVADLINGQLIKSENANPYRLDTKKAKEVPYFSGFTKIVPEPRLNKLIILGRPQAIERLKDFIKKYIDVAPDSGKSMLHVYKLQYLNANEIARVLENIIRGGEKRGPGQASAGFSSEGGIERFFDKVIIATDSPLNEGGDKANTEFGQQKYTYYGGNNLIVTARNDDWQQIKKLIEELDIPQAQVLIEVLIADLTAEDARLLGSMLRIPDKIPFPDSMAFQAAMLAPPIPSAISNNPPTPSDATINADLSRNAYTASVIPTLAIPGTSGVRSVPTFAPVGTTLLSLNDNDGDTWSILEILQSFTDSKILSHPHIMTKNNNEAQITIGQTRWLKDKVKDIASNYYGGATTINYKAIAADLNVRITPRISSANTVNLQVVVDINEWQVAGDVKDIRKLETNANVKDGGIFALGGLIRTNTTSSVQETPILGKIPILGWFFKRRSKDVKKNNLTVFISPTIIAPRLRQGVDEYTHDYINVAKDFSGGELFDSLKDPITRWFFRGDVDVAGSIDKFTAKDEALVASRKRDEPARLKKEYDILSEQEETSAEDEGPLAKKAGIDISCNEIIAPVESVAVTNVNTSIAAITDITNEAIVPAIASDCSVTENITFVPQIAEVIDNDSVIAENTCTTAQKQPPSSFLTAHNEENRPTLSLLKEIIGEDESPFNPI